MCNIIAQNNTFSVRATNADNEGKTKINILYEDLEKVRRLKEEEEESQIKRLNNK